ncbi:MAG TPA: RHS repeat-associated core domain-containing protein [Nitrospiria bacterium]|jgi:RHS repeat-associated protein|nr:RHS repeat-associated core domain-containing protein [Nitrospiria bacterium]
MPEVAGTTVSAPQSRAWRAAPESYYRARYYDPNSGRFLKEDPIGFQGGGANFYAYTANSPLNFRDPSGLDYRTSYSSGKISVSLEIVLYGKGANPTLAALWQKAIADKWNQNPGYGRCKAVFDVSVSADPGANNIFSAQWRSYYGPKNWIRVPPNGQLGDNGVNPITMNSGSWWSQLDLRTVAHEAGHLLGFWDHINPLTNAPWKGSENDIMAESGNYAILQQEIDSIVGKWYDKECKCGQ